MKKNKNKKETHFSDNYVNQEMKKPKKRFGRRKKTDQIIRIEELEEVMSRYGKDVDPEDIVSMYIPHRRRRRIGAALLQLDKLHLLLMGLMLLVAILFITAFMQEKMGNFTINLNRLELYRKGISISDTGDFEKSTFTVTDKVYDRAMPIELNERADEFECEPQPACYVTAEHLEYLFQKAKAEHPISDELLDKMQKLDSYLATRFKLSFGNRIMKQMYDFIPVYVACGGTELDGMDYIVARKVLKKFESMNVNFVRDEITGLINYIEKTFGKAGMEDSKSYLRRIQNLY